MSSCGSVPGPQYYWIQGQAEASATTTYQLSAPLGADATLIPITDLSLTTPVTK